MSPKWIRFDQMPPVAGRKTRQWAVIAKMGDQHLGIVSWDSAWRKYAFWPCEGSGYEQECLRDIAKFVETATRDHYAANATMEGAS